MSEAAEDARDSEEFRRELRISHKWGTCDAYYCPYCLWEWEEKKEEKNEHNF